MTKFERTGKEVISATFEVLFLFCWSSWRNEQPQRVRILWHCLARGLSNTKQNAHHLAVVCC